MLCSLMRLIFKTSSVTSDFFYVFNIILSFSNFSQSFKKICTWELLGVKTESVSVLFRFVIVAVFERIAVEYTYRVFSLFATQFTVEKSNLVESFAMIDCFCSTTSYFERNFTPGKQFWRP